jgi:hypothetical protein
MNRTDHQTRLAKLLRQAPSHKTINNQRYTRYGIFKTKAAALAAGVAGDDRRATVHLLNPTAAPAEVEVTLLTAGGAVMDEELPGIAVEPGATASLRVDPHLPDGTEAYSDWIWYTPDEPSIQELAWEAYGRLVIPEFRLAFNPSEQAIIFVDTWWWAEGAGDGAVRGSSAAGLVAVAEPDRLEVDPGDGSGTIVCGWVTAKCDTCTHAYQKASAGGYPARARLVYGVHFEQNGQVLDVPGLPETLESGWEETTVPVHEVQAIVR